VFSRRVRRLFLCPAVCIFSFANRFDVPRFPRRFSVRCVCPRAISFLLGALINKGLWTQFVWRAPLSRAGFWGIVLLPRPRKKHDFSPAEKWPGGLSAARNNMKKIFCIIYTIY